MTTDHTATSPKPLPGGEPTPRRTPDRLLNLIALLAIVAVSAAVYVFAGGVALAAVDAAAATLYALWLRGR